MFGVVMCLDEKLNKVADMILTCDASDEEKDKALGVIYDARDALLFSGLVSSYLALGSPTCGHEDHFSSESDQ